MGETPRGEEELPPEAAAQDAKGVKDVTEPPFDKNEVCQKIESDVDDLFERYGNNLPTEIESMGEEVRDITDAMKRSTKVSRREDFIEDLKFRKGKISDQAYAFILERMN
jgi:hypothetical protein